jgi:hypothetical protein
MKRGLEDIKDVYSEAQLQTRKVKISENSLKKIEPNLTETTQNELNEVKILWTEDPNNSSQEPKPQNPLRRKSELKEKNRKSKILKNEKVYREVIRKMMMKNMERADLTERIVKKVENLKVYVKELQEFDMALKQRLAQQLKYKNKLRDVFFEKICTLKKENEQLMKEKQDNWKDNGGEKSEAEKLINEIMHLKQKVKKAFKIKGRRCEEKA